MYTHNTDLKQSIIYMMFKIIEMYIIKNLFL